MGDLIVGIVAVAGVAAIWGVLSGFALGRAIQVLITAMVYGAWLSIIPIGLYFLGGDIRDAISNDRYGEAAFIAVMSVLMTPVLLFPLIPWNYFCRFVWRKVGLKLPQSSKLGGDRECYDWERER